MENNEKTETNYKPLKIFNLLVGLSAYIYAIYDGFFLPEIDNVSIAIIMGSALIVSGSTMGKKSKKVEIDPKISKSLIIGSSITVVLGIFAFLYVQFL